LGRSATKKKECIYLNIENIFSKKKYVGREL